MSLRRWRKVRNEILDVVRTCDEDAETSNKGWIWQKGLTTNQIRNKEWKTSEESPQSGDCGNLAAVGQQIERLAKAGCH